MNMAISATRPKSSGARILARAMVTPNWISCVPARSKNFQKRDDMILRLLGIFFTDATKIDIRPGISGRLP